MRRKVYLDAHASRGVGGTMRGIMRRFSDRARARHGRLHGGRGFAAKLNVENGVSAVRFAADAHTAYQSRKLGGTL